MIVLLLILLKLALLIRLYLLLKN